MAHERSRQRDARGGAIRVQIRFLHRRRGTPRIPAQRRQRRETSEESVGSDTIEKRKKSLVYAGSGAPGMKAGAAMRCVCVELPASPCSCRLKKTERKKRTNGETNGRSSRRVTVWARFAVPTYRACGCGRGQGQRSPFRWCSVRERSCWRHPPCRRSAAH